MEYIWGKVYPHGLCCYALLLIKPKEVTDLKKKKIALFISLSLMVQVLVFTFLDVQTKELLNPSFQFDQKAVLQADVSKAHSFSLSYNNRYLAYLSDGRLHVQDLISNQDVLSREVLPAEEMELAFKWLPDRNSLVYLSKKSEGVNRSPALWSLDLESNTGSGGRIDATPRQDRVLEIEFREIIGMEVSTYTNKMYILYRDQKLHNRLITMDIMMNINRLDDPEESIRALAVSNKFGTVYLETIKAGEKAILAVIGRERETVTDNHREILLGSWDDGLFTGLTENNMLREILYYSSDESGNRHKKSLWKGNISFQSSNVLISSVGKIMLAQDQRLDVVDLQGNLVSVTVPENHTVIPSPTGMMYIDLTPQTAEFCWKEI